MPKNGKMTDLNAIKRALLRTKLEWMSQLDQVLDELAGLSGSDITVTDVVLSQANWARHTSNAGEYTQTFCAPELLAGRQWLYLVCGDENCHEAGIKALDVKTDGQMEFRCPAGSLPDGDVTARIIRLEVT